MQQSIHWYSLTIPTLQKEKGLFQYIYTKALIAAIIIQFVSMIVLLIITSCSSLLLRSSAQVEPAISTASHAKANRETKLISPAHFVDPIPVNVISSSQNTEIDLRFGYSKRGVNCQFFSETIALVLQKELNLNTTLIRFETENELFDALTEGKIDLTLCFIDPLDRVELIKPERLGHISQIGAYYWADEHKKLQVWAHSYTKTELRNEMPCVYHFFEKMRFTEITLNEANDALPSENNPLEWYQNHTNEVREWLKCFS
jgi:hypothetical protein